MDCFEAQEQILEALAESQPGEIPFGLKSHLADCEICREFVEVQSSLDRQLTTLITAPVLSPTFRASLAKRVRREPLSAWPEFLPDAAHMVGCVCATVLCLAMLPFPAAPMIVAAGAFTLVTYFVQTAIRGSLETLDNRY